MNPINPPPKLDDFKAVIEQRRPTNTTSELLFWVRSQGVKTSERALQRKLKDWGITKQAPITIKDDETYPILVEAVNKIGRASW
jgi:transposase